MAVSRHLSLQKQATIVLKSSSLEKKVGWGALGAKLVKRLTLDLSDLSSSPAMCSMVVTKPT